MLNPLFTDLTCGGALLLAFLLFNRPKNNNVTGNRWLGAFVATFAAAMLEISLHNLKLNSRFPAFLDMVEVSRFLSAPTLFLSILFFTTPARSFKSKDLLHFVPFLAFLLFLLPHMLTGNNVRFDNPAVARIVFTLIKFILPALTVIYWYLSYRKLKQHQRNIEQISSATDAIDLKWLKNFLLVLAAVIIIWFNLAFFNVSHLSGITPFLYLISVYFLAFFSLSQKEIYNFSYATLQELNSMITPDSPTAENRQKRLSDSQALYLKEKLALLMAVEKPYLNNELSLPILADKMEITIHELSYLINDVYGENFFSFVNRYRVEEAKRLLMSEKFEKFNMIGIAFQAGFNSKTTFNTAFRKITGKSPTEFYQSAKRSDA